MHIELFKKIHKTLKYTLYVDEVVNKEEERTRIWVTMTTVVLVVLQWLWLCLQMRHDFLQLMMETEAEDISQAAVDEEINHRDQLNTTQQWTRKGILIIFLNVCGFLAGVAAYFLQDSS